MDKKISSYILEGKLYVRLIIEILGKPKHYLSQIMKRTLDMLYKYDGVIEKIKETIEEPEPVDKTTDESKIDENKKLFLHKDLYHIFAEVELILKDLESLSKICLDFTPSSVEIIEPEKLTLSNNQLTHFFNNLTLKLSNLILETKDHQARTILLSKNINKIIQNFVYFSLKLQPMTIEQLSKITGLDKIYLDKILMKLVEDGRILKQDNKFKLKR